MLKRVTVILMISQGAFAGTVNLNAGESIQIDANTMTTVNCEGGSNGNCQQQLAAFQQLLQSCEQNESGGQCIDAMWPNFKSKNPNCVAMATQTCLTACEQNYSGGQCAIKCQ